MMFRSRGLLPVGRVVTVVAAFAALVVTGAAPAQARVVSSQTFVSTSDTLVAGISSTDGCIESSLFLFVGRSVSRIGGGAPVAGGTVLYTRYDECSGQYLAGIGNEPFYIESGGLSVNGALRYATARFTTSAPDQVTHDLLEISVDLTFTGTGDVTHGHEQGIFYGDGFTSVSQDSEWFRTAHITGTFSVGGVDGTADPDDQYGTIARGKSTIVTQTFGPPFPH